MQYEAECVHLATSEQTELIYLNLAQSNKLLFNLIKKNICCLSLLKFTCCFCVSVFEFSALFYKATETDRSLIDLIWLLLSIFHSYNRKLPSSLTLSLSFHLPDSLPPICPDLHGNHMALAPWLGILWKICRR